MMRIVKLCSILAVAVSFLGAREACAQERFGSAGSFAVSAERLMGFVYARTSSEVLGVTTTRSNTTLTFLNSASFDSAMSGPTTNYSSARIAFDFFPINGLSLGGSIGLYHVSSSVEQEANGLSQEEDLGSGLGFIFTPRIGYAVMFTPKVGLWPRGGVSYASVHAESPGGSELTASGVAITLESPFVIAPVPHVAFLVGPSLDLGVGGSTETQGAGGTTVSRDRTGTDIGVHGGMTAFF
ncbi:MAG: hypothetical protein ACOY0T_30075 [Myxococcota bacterium]